MLTNWIFTIIRSSTSHVIFRKSNQHDSALVNVTLLLLVCSGCLHIFRYDMSPSLDLFLHFFEDDTCPLKSC